MNWYAGTLTTAAFVALGPFGCGGSIAQTADAGALGDEVDASAFPDATTSVDAGTFEVGPNPGDKACPGAFSCLDCCATNHPQGSAQWGAFAQDCACEGGPCGQACEFEFCIGMGPYQGDHCDQCLQPALAGPCAAPIAENCATQLECSEFILCVHHCPPDAGG